jgi:ABC-2 type transport system permease protein
MLQRLFALVQKEFIQIRRDPRTLAMMIILPLLWLVMFGYAFSFDVKEITVAVVDQSGNPVGAKLADTLKGYDRFVPVDLADRTESGIRAAIHRDEIQMGMLIPADLGRGGQVKVLLDGTNLFAAQAGSRHLQKALEPLQRAAAPQAGAPQLIPQLETLYNPDLQSAPVMIPGLLGLVTMFMAIMMTALGVVREREYGTMEQLVVTPIRPFELMLGKLIPYALVAALDFTLVFAAGTYLFDLDFAGNLPAFLGLTLLFLVTTLGLGLLISTVAQNQQQAMQLAMLAIFPQILVSGLIFPLSSMPKVIQYIAYALPFTHFVPIARGIFIKGQEVSLLSTQVTVLAVYAVGVVTLASLRFRKRLG